MIEKNEADGLLSRHGKRLNKIRAWADHAALNREKWRKRNAYFHKLDTDFLKFLISPGQKVLALGCGSGAKLACLEPAVGVGIDLSKHKIDLASKIHLSLIHI